VRSWLLELVERMLAREVDLASVAPYVSDSGEGRWTIQAAIDEDVPVPVIAASLFARFASRDPYNFSARFAAGLRNQFGGHEIKKAEERKIEATGAVKGET
jgi:6-phosphogluconate dehydrogenase